jgi:hypothetical protein
MMTPPCAFRRQRGQSLIEFALVLPILALLMVGAVDLTHMYYDDGIMHQVVTETGKLAMVEHQGHVYTNDELLHWMRTAAMADDPTISRGDITAAAATQINPWEFDGAHFDQISGDPAHDPSGVSASPANAETTDLTKAAPATSGQQTADSSQQSCSTHFFNGLFDAERLINPGLETIRVRFSFNAAIFNTLHAPPITYTKAITQYQFLALPIPNPGCVSGGRGP